jgi:hypothetical protein
MSTTPIDTWAVDLADVTAIYPWVGGEGIMALIAVVLWILWHVWQIRHEQETYDQQIHEHGDAETINKSIGDND